MLSRHISGLALRGLPLQPRLPALRPFSASTAPPTDGAKPQDFSATATAADAAAADPNAEPLADEVPEPPKMKRVRKHFTPKQLAERAEKKSKALKEAAAAAAAAAEAASAATTADATAAATTGAAAPAKPPSRVSALLSRLSPRSLFRRKPKAPPAPKPVPVRVSLELLLKSPGARLSEAEQTDLLARATARAEVYRTSDRFNSAHKLWGGALMAMSAVVPFALCAFPDLGWLTTYNLEWVLAGAVALPPLHGLRKARTVPSKVTFLWGEETARQGAVLVAARKAAEKAAKEAAEKEAAEKEAKTAEAEAAAAAKAGDKAEDAKKDGAAKAEDTTKDAKAETQTDSKPDTETKAADGAKAEAEADAAEDAAVVENPPLLPDVVVIESVPFPFLKPYVYATYPEDLKLVYLTPRVQWAAPSARARRWLPWARRWAYTLYSKRVGALHPLYFRGMQDVTALDRLMRFAAQEGRFEDLPVVPAAATATAPVADAATEAAAQAKVDAVAFAVAEHKDEQAALAKEAANEAKVVDEAAEAKARDAKTKAETTATTTAAPAADAQEAKLEDETAAKDGETSAKSEDAKSSDSKKAK